MTLNSHESAQPDAHGGLFGPSCQPHVLSPTDRIRRIRSGSLTIFITNTTRCLATSQLPGAQRSIDGLEQAPMISLPRPSTAPHVPSPPQVRRKGVWSVLAGSLDSISQQRPHRPKCLDDVFLECMNLHWTSQTLRWLYEIERRSEIEDLVGRCFLPPEIREWCSNVAAELQNEPTGIPKLKFCGNRNYAQKVPSLKGMNEATLSSQRSSAVITASVTGSRAKRAKWRAFGKIKRTHSQRANGSNTAGKNRRAMQNERAELQNEPTSDLDPSACGQRR